MDARAFESRASEDGFKVVEKSVEPDSVSAEHEHAWDTFGLVTAGAFTIDVDATPRTYRAGETFEAPSGVCAMTSAPDPRAPA